MSTKSAAREWGKSIAFAFVIWIVLKIFLVEAFRIPSPSMVPTLLPGDFLFVNKAIYGPVIPLVKVQLPAIREPRVGEIVVFKSVETAGMDIVKRLIGTPGDTLEMRHSRVYRNGQLDPEAFTRHSDTTKTMNREERLRMRLLQLPHYVGADAAAYQPDLQDWGPIVVPNDSLFVMGDNREDSYDGRFWGFLPRSNVRGTPIIFYYSYDPDSWRALPFLTAIRWNRILHRPS